jgi:hypothetical protein
LIPNLDFWALCLLRQCWSCEQRQSNADTEGNSHETLIVAFG